jgi:hypothetical protein
LYVYDEHPKDFIDHINRNPDDNRICNLRLATRSQNQQNTKIKITNTSGAKGVSYISSSRNWRARITKDHKTYDLGKFKTFESALKARQDAEDAMFTHHKG